MSRLQMILTAPSRFSTWTHHQLWAATNLWRGYQVAPFSARYWWTRARLVSEVCDYVLADPSRWESVLRQPRFVNYDERVVEYPWALARIRQDGGRDRFLDVGCVMNTEYCLRQLCQQYPDVHLLNLVSEPLAFHGRISLHCQDIRGCDLPRQSFDAVTCLSTIEHVGGDNSYNVSPNGTAELADSSAMGTCWQPAFLSLLSLVKPGGLLMVSMPFGGGLWKDGFYEFGPADVSALHDLAARDGRRLRTRVFGKDATGWRLLSDGQAMPGDDLPESSAGSRAVLLVETE